jgi:hypothetical protein
MINFLHKFQRNGKQYAWVLMQDLSGEMVPVCIEIVSSLEKKRTPQGGDLS